MIEEILPLVGEATTELCLMAAHAVAAVVHLSLIVRKLIMPNEVEYIKLTETVEVPVTKEVTVTKYKPILPSQECLDWIKFFRDNYQKFEYKHQFFAPSGIQLGNAFFWLRELAGGNPATIRCQTEDGSEFSLLTKENESENEILVPLFKEIMNAALYRHKNEAAWKQQEMKKTLLGKNQPEDKVDIQYTCNALVESKEGVLYNGHPIKEWIEATSQSQPVSNKE